MIRATAKQSGKQKSELTGYTNVNSRPHQDDGREWKKKKRDKTLTWFEGDKEGIIICIEIYVEGLSKIVTCFKIIKLLLNKCCFILML